MLGLLDQMIRHMLIQNGKKPKENQTMFLNQVKAHISTILDKIETPVEFDEILPEPKALQNHVDFT